MKLTNYIEKNDYIINTEEDYLNILREQKSVQDKRIVLAFKGQKNLINIIEKNRSNDTFLYTPFSSLIALLFKVEIDLREDVPLIKQLRRSLAEETVTTKAIKNLLNLYMLGQISEQEVFEYIKCNSNDVAW